MSCQPLRPFVRLKPNTQSAAASLLPSPPSLPVILKLHFAISLTKALIKTRGKRRRRGNAAAKPSEQCRERECGSGRESSERARPKMELKRYIMTCAMTAQQMQPEGGKGRERGDIQYLAIVVIYRREICFEIYKILRDIINRGFPYMMSAHKWGRRSWNSTVCPHVRRTSEPPLLSLM